jgi:carbamoyl-phosphate synthase small subunit
MDTSMSTTEPTETASLAPDFGAFPRPAGATGVVVLSDGTLLWGKGLGAEGSAVGEVVFNTFTFPHIGNVGANAEDIESLTPFARGVILRADVTEPSSWRATAPLTGWLASHGLVGISGIDTRQLTRRIREIGAPHGVIAHSEAGEFDLDALLAQAKAWPGLKGMDLAKEVSCRQTYTWDEALWSLGGGYARQENPQYHVVAVDYGAKRNILRCLAAAGCKVTVVPANASAEDILRHKPDGVFLANVPGDPEATGEYAVPVIQDLIKADMPIFGICLGHQLLARALGMRTHKMATGHRGANHPVKDLATGKVEITSQNHGFVVDEESLTPDVEITHRSLFDGSVEGLASTKLPVFSVQYHPEASPGPTDSHYLFQRFIDLIASRR